MVQGVDLIQVDVAFLSYNPHRNIDKPKIKLDNTCIAGHYELRKHRECKKQNKHGMGVDAYKHYKWYNLTLRKELERGTQNSRLKIIHWHIESSNSDAFIMDNVLYKAVSIIIGQETEHWYCANIGDNPACVHGSRDKLKLNNDQQQMALAASSGICSSLQNSDNLNAFNLFNNNKLKFINNSYRNTNYKKCTIEYCANNCINCNKYISPYTNGKNIKRKCACYIEKKFERIIEENDNDINELSNNDNYNIINNNNNKVIKNNLKINKRKTSTSSLDTIHEES